MRLVRYTSSAALASAAAACLAAARANGAKTFGLPTGRTPVEAYAALAAMSASWASARVFALDEFVGLGASHPASFRAYLEQHVVGPLRLGADQIDWPHGDAPDLTLECARYDAAIESAGGLDLLLLGIGGNGHIGFNEPGPALNASTHVVDLREETRRANARRFQGDTDAVPVRAITMGVGAMLRSRRIVMMASGADKADALHDMMAGPITTECPASLLQVHPDVDVLVDQAAARRL